MKSRENKRKGPPTFSLSFDLGFSWTILEIMADGCDENKIREEISF